MPPLDQSRDRPPRGRVDAEIDDDWDDDGVVDRQASPREIARYLVTLKPQVARAIQVRQQWIKELGILLEEARHGNAQQVVTRAGRLGREHLPAFRDVRAAVERTRPPDGCEEVFAAIVTWVANLVRACEGLIEVGNSGSLAGMEIVQRHVTEARHAARRFNSEYTRLVTELRIAVRAARRT